MAFSYSSHNKPRSIKNTNKAPNFGLRSALIRAPRPEIPWRAVDIANVLSCFLNGKT